MLNSLIEREKTCQRTQCENITVVCAHSACADTDQAYYDLIVKKASAMLSSVQVNMLKFALSLRAYSATVHSFQQVPGSWFIEHLKAFTWTLNVCERSFRFAFLDSVQWASSLWLLSIFQHPWGKDVWCRKFSSTAENSTGEVNKEKYKL